MSWVTRLLQLFSLLLGGASGGMLFTYTSRGAITWWLVVLVLLWVMCFGAQSFSGAYDAQNGRRR